MDLPDPCFACTTCGANFTSHEAFQQHVLQHNDVNQQEVNYLCNKCGSVFDSQTSLQNHHCDTIQFDSLKQTTRPRKYKSSGDKQFTCPICNQGFARKDTLEVHRKIHLDTKEFECEVCGSQFRQKGHLTRHMNIHLERIDVRCEVCGKEFHRMDQYNQHMKRFHLSREQEYYG
ncbi:Zinc finger, C2H2 type domain-containing protein [Spironucleus salmonicida]|uniref:Zinc finger, C2H2 type domain-containing protein n=1 Tax=Spironucleus salmonicida TaxID=348837 RepID=V6LBG1_9EUKA|nr:Zinc finger, C2H2 type domain-containing protein [Spironucleus salmonicida]KAH0573259.1 Zinc finger, C2H2 type domain-containing protein [Spironucleus salmonicida]|eukprot:EST41747.1 Zinc finger, C2H2 type domain-containing protein [Spironucleus salmonicida]